MAEYKVQFEVFEGPLDLLLYLVKKVEVDIYQVNLTRLAEQFIEYVDLMRELDLDIAGEFLVMASTLMYIKSRELLPVDQQTRVEDEGEDTEDPRWELIRKLVEYKKYKEASGRLREMSEVRERVFPRDPGKLEFEAPPRKMQVSIFDLVNAVGTVLRRVRKTREGEDIFEDKWTVSEKIDYLRHTLHRRSSIRFSELFSTSTSKAEVVVTFLALLELIRLNQLAATQAEVFGEIDLTAVSAASASGPEDPTGEAVPSETGPGVPHGEPADADDVAHLPEVQ